MRTRRGKRQLESSDFTFLNGVSIAEKWWGRATEQLPNSGLSPEDASITTLEVEPHPEIPIYGGVSIRIIPDHQNSVFERRSNP